MAETKVCDNCEQEIGASETVCPKCKVNFEELDQEVAVVERAAKVAEKRRKASEPSPVVDPTPAPTPAKKKSVFRSLSRLGEK